MRIHSPYPASLPARLHVEVASYWSLISSIEKILDTGIDRAGKLEAKRSLIQLSVPDRQLRDTQYAIGGSLVHVPYTCDAVWLSSAG